MTDGYGLSWHQPERYRYVVCIDGEPVASAQHGDTAMAYMMWGVQSSAVCMRSVEVRDSSNGGILYWYERGV